MAVEPREGITILFDGQKVACASGWQDHNVALGAHVLEVRAMGYWPVTLPLAVDANHPLRVPVRLRARAPLPFAPLAAPAATAPPAPAANATGRAAQAPPTESRARPHRPLPGGTRPLRITIAARPAAAIAVDGVAVDADDVRFTQAEGQLVVGEMSLQYRVRAGRRLEFILPADPADSAGVAGADPVLWFTGATQIKAKSAVALGANAVTLQRTRQQRTQRAIFVRID